ncbi:MAG: 3'-5' exoribonuclease [Clostridia bacterium]|nr:3'-5' exoribonuclease [Clostridia bacterium]
MNRLDEYLREIRAIAGLQNALLKSITVSKRDRIAEFLLITDKAYTAREEAEACGISGKYLPADFRAKTRIVKRVPDEEIVKRRIYDFVSSKFPAAAAFLDEKSIHVDMLSSGANFCFDIASGEQSLFTSGKILDEVSAYLQSGYCGTFYGTVRIVEKEEPSDELLNEIPETQEEEAVKEIRRFEICDFVKIDGAEGLPKNATYIADHGNEEGVLAVCGSLTYIEEKEYTKHNEKTGEDVQKSRFVITLSDGTGTLRTTYFPKKATVEKVRELKIGDKIVITGQNEEFNGYRSFKAAKINFGAPPENFVPKARKGKPVPKYYHTVFPENYVDYTQAGFFDTLEKPDDLKNNAFVVFDLETTGLNNNPAMGKMDKIIEIGAVKLVGGEIKEKFSTFVACEERLSKEIIDLTGITDADLIGAPTIDKTIADFFKFIEGAYLVGHNVNFDLNFVRYYAEQNGYMIDNRQFDTLTLAQELLRGELANYKLNTVADYYGFTFNHHRAFDDACVTAKIFIEFMKKRGKLPL